ncbi:hypothetical protein N9V27_01050 [bacterium]|jgi:hypothetical protein|nr:hypothetical protein [bacterium]
MKKTKDDYQCILQGMRLIEDLLIPQVTPRVPSHIRERAREVIAEFPTEENLKNLLTIKKQKSE